MITFSNRTYLITGATSGIGNETAKVLHRLGARLVLTGRSKEKLENLSRELAPHKHVLQPVDLETIEDIPHWIKAIVDEVGPLNGFVHSAGICQILPARALSLKRFERLMHINLFSAMMIVRGLLQSGCHVKKQTSIVLIASTSGIVGCPGLTLYAASKGGLIAFVKSAALELAPSGIRINTVSPAFVETPLLASARKSIPEENYQHICSLHPLGIGQPLDVAQAVAFLLSDASRWNTGTNFILDGGLTAA